MLGVGWGAQVMIIQFKIIPVTFTFWFLIHKAMNKILSYCSKFIIIKGPFQYTGAEQKGVLNDT